MKKNEEKKVRENEYRRCRALGHSWHPVSLRSSEYIHGHIDERVECDQCTTQRLRVLDRRFKIIATYYFYPRDYMVDLPMAKNVWREGYITFSLHWTGD